MDYIGLIAAVGGQVLGQLASQTDKDTAMNLVQQATDAYGKINVPALKELFLKNQQKSGLGDIKEDPRYRDQLNAADSQNNDIIRSGGLTLADKAALNKIRNDSMRAESGGRNAILQGMAARGTLDSGAGLAAQLQGNQQTSNRLAEGDEATAGQAQARAYQAIKDRANMASQGLDRDWRQKSEAARAQDAINAGNTAIQNTAARYNAGIPQQDFANQLTLTNAQSKAKSDMAFALQSRAAATQAGAQDIGNTVAKFSKDNGTSGNGTSATAPNSTDSNDYAGRGSPGDLTGGHTDTDDALTGQSTRPPTDGRVITGYDADGRPIYGNRGSNF